jgi:soluble cytochrome b562
MNNNNVIYLAEKFFKLSSFTEEALEELKDLEKEFKYPTKEDKADVKIILTRIKKNIEQNNLTAFKASMKSLDTLCRNFLHEKFNDEFLDFISDQDLWEWVHKFNPSQPTNNDIYLITEIIYQELNSILKKNNLFIL